MSMAASALFRQQAQADALAATLAAQDLVVVDRRDEIISEDAPAPYTTADLLADAIPRYGWSGKQVMDIAQRLFEAGRITYPRTDSQRLTPDAQAAIRDSVSAIYGADMLGPRGGGNLSTTIVDLDDSGNFSTTTPEKSLLDFVVEKFLPQRPKKTVLEKQAPEKPQVKTMSPNGAAVSANHKKNSIEDAHEAIRPTDPARQPQSLDTPREQVQLYTLIWQRTLASQMKPARYRHITLEMEATG